MSRCKSCRADVDWAVTAEGKWMPVDTAPTPDGNVLLEPRTGQPAIATVLGAAAAQNAAADGKTLRKSHFATCPNSKKHRKAR